MTTNLLISYPDIPFRSIETYSELTPGGGELTWLEDWPYRNTIAGERYQYANSDNTNSLVIEYDLGTGNSAAADHLIVGRADRLKTQGVTTLVLGVCSTGLLVGGTGTAQHSTSSFDTDTLYGPRAEDYFVSGLSIAASRGWYLSCSGGASGPRTLSSVHFGTSFDMGRNPDYEFERVPAKEFTFYADSGAAFLTRLEEPVYSFSFTWKGVTDAKAKEFLNTIVKASEVYKHRFFLYTTGAHEILDNVRLVQVALFDHSVRKSATISDWNEVTADFIEVLG